MPELLHTLWHYLLPFVTEVVCCPLGLSSISGIWRGWPSILALGRLLSDWPLAASHLFLPFQGSDLLFSGLFPTTFHHIMASFSEHYYITPENHIAHEKTRHTWLCTIYLEHIFTVVIAEKVCKKRKTVIIFIWWKCCLQNYTQIEKLCTVLRPKEMQVNQGLPCFLSLSPARGFGAPCRQDLASVLLKAYPYPS